MRCFDFDKLTNPLYLLSTFAPQLICQVSCMTVLQASFFFAAGGFPSADVILSHLRTTGGVIVSVFCHVASRFPCLDPPPCYR